MRNLDSSNINYYTGGIISRDSTNQTEVYQSSQPIQQLLPTNNNLLVSPTTHYCKLDLLSRVVDSKASLHASVVQVEFSQKLTSNFNEESETGKRAIEISSHMNASQSRGDQTPLYDEEEEFNRETREKKVQAQSIPVLNVDRKNLEKKVEKLETSLKERNKRGDTPKSIQSSVKSGTKNLKAMASEMLSQKNTSRASKADVKTVNKEKREETNGLKTGEVRETHRRPGLREREV